MPLASLATMPDEAGRQQMLERHRQQLAARREQQFRDADRDGDRGLSRDELRASQLPPVLLQRFDEIDRDHDGRLSPEELQALGFARVLLLKPKWVFIDDALSALETEERQALMKVFTQELAGSAVIATGRVGAEDGFYGKTLHLRRCTRAEAAAKTA